MHHGFEMFTVCMRTFRAIIFLFCAFKYFVNIINPSESRGLVIELASNCDLEN